MQACAPRPRDEAHLEAFRRVGALYDLKLPVAHGCEDFAELMCIVAVVGPDELQPGKELLELLEQIDGAVAILPIGRMRDRVQKPAARQEKVTPPRRASSSIPEAPVVDLGVRRMRCAKASSAQRETRPAERVGLPQAFRSQNGTRPKFSAAQQFRLVTELLTPSCRMRSPATSDERTATSLSIGVQSRPTSARNSAKPSGAARLQSWRCVPTTYRVVNSSTPILVNSSEPFDTHALAEPKMGHSPEARSPPPS